MECEKCHKDIDNDSSFCSKCGVKVEKRPLEIVEEKETIEKNEQQENNDKL